MFFALMFGLVFHNMGSGHFVVNHLPYTLLTMLCYSGVTFTPLGFGDISPHTEAVTGLVMVEVTLDYIILGGGG
ncbi:hypothetical protein DFAR_2550012 [Desulfarculales bacterium]